MAVQLHAGASAVHIELQVAAFYNLPHSSPIMTQTSQVPDVESRAFTLLKLACEIPYDSFPALKDTATMTFSVIEASAVCV